MRGLLKYVGRSIVCLVSNKGAETRVKLLDATRTLVEARGYFGTGLNQIIETSGAPRGSLYFHFPGGKDQLVGEAIGRSGTDIAELIALVEAPDAREFVRQLLTLLGDRLEQSDWTSGCPVAAVALDVASSNDTVQQACSAVYRQWEDVLRDRLTAYGHPEPERLTTAVLAMIEGGLILARTHRDRTPLRQLAEIVDILV